MAYHSAQNNWSLSGALSSVWPGMSYLAFGILGTWLYLVQSGLIWVSDVEVSGSKLSYLYFNIMVTTAATFILAGIFQKWFLRILRSRVAIRAFGTLAMLGALMIILAGPYYVSAISLARVGCIFIGCGISVTLLKLGQLFGALKPQAQLINILLSSLAGGLLFFFVLGNPLFYPVAGGPSFGGIMAFMLLPLFASYLVTMQPDAAKGFLVKQQEQEPSVFSSNVPLTLFAKFFLAIMIFSFSNTVIQGFFFSLSIPAHIGTSFSLATFFFMLLVVAVFLLVIRFLRRIALGKVYLFTMVSVAIILGLIPVLQISNDVITVAVTVAVRVFDCVIWLLLASAVYSSRLSAVSVFGYGRGAFAAGAAVGCYVGMNVLPEIMNVDTEPILYIGLAFLLLVCTTLIFSEKDFDKLFLDGNKLELVKSDLITESEGESPKDKQTHSDSRPWITACKVVGMAACLSNREQEILELLARGRTPEGIAQQLFLSKNTVRSHTHTIYQKLNVHSRQELADLIELECSNKRSA